MSRRGIGRAGRSLLVAAVAAWAACASPPPLIGPDVVAKVGGDEVPHAEFSRYLQQNLGESGAGLESEALSSLLDRFLEERLLVRLARERGLVTGVPEPAQAVEALLESDPAPPITETAIASYYAEHGEQFRVPEKVALRAIRTDDRAAAERARRELAAGADFAAVARRLSVDPSAESGGDQGELGRDELPPALSDVAFRLAPGKLSDILSTSAGFYLLRVERRLPERVPALAEVREEIRRRLLGARGDRAYARFVGEARSRYAVEVFDRNLPFVYGGEFPVSRPYENR
jgi:peptidyl-prolyl cis-trans isomerase C